MPNWTNNQLTVGHKDKDVIKALLDYVNEHNAFFDHVHPMPENTFRGNLGSDEREMCQREGRPNWFDWCSENWSTKWDANVVDVTYHTENSITIHFDTAWCAPYGVYNALAEQGFEVEAYYVSFENWDAGEWHYDPDNPTDIHDVHIDDLDDGVTDEIDNVFNVTEQVREFLVERVHDEIVYGLDKDDTTALYELLSQMDDDALRNYLPR